MKLTESEFWTLHISSFSLVHLEALPWEATNLLHLNLIQSTQSEGFRPTNLGIEYLKSAKMLSVEELPINSDGIRRMLTNIMPKERVLPNWLSAQTAQEKLMEALSRSSWERLGLIEGESEKQMLTGKGYQLVQHHAKNLIIDIQKDFNPGNLRQTTYYKMLIDLIDPEQWAVILPAISNQTASYFAELLRQKT